MTQKNQKHTSQAVLTLRMIKRAYMPGGINRMYTITMIWGGMIGGVLGGTVASSYGAMMWAVILSACMGVVSGATIALTLVSREQ